MKSYQKNMNELAFQIIFFKKTHTYMGIKKIIFKTVHCIF